MSLSLASNRPLRAWFDLLHPGPSLLVTAFTAAFSLAVGGDDAAVRTALLATGMLAYQFAIGVTNDVADYEHDAAEGRDKPLVSGAVGREFARRLAALLMLAGMLITFPLPLAAWLLGIGGLACGLLYNAGLKRSSLGWLPLAVALPLVPTWVLVAADRWDPFVLWAFPLGAMLGFAVFLANQAPDLETDHEPSPIVARLGQARSLQLAFATFGLATTAAIIISIPRSLSVALAIAAAGALVSLLGPRFVRRMGPRGMFVALTSGSAVVGLLFLGALEI